MGMKRKMVIDVDTGLDDAQAIMMALSDEDTQVVGITCVAGNIGIDQVCQNTLRVLKAWDKLEAVPVYKGCTRPLLGNIQDASYFHGNDGLGEVPDVEPLAPCIDHVQPGHAAYVLVDLVNKYPGELTLVALAPLTNIAMAIRLDSEFGKKLKDCVIMGGNIYAKGNWSAALMSSEFNFGADAESAYITLNELGCPIKLISWETCLGVQIPWEWYNNLEDRTPKGSFHKKIQTYSSSRKINIFHRPYYYSCDPTAMAVALDAGVVLDSGKYYCSVELQGQLTRGQMVVDWRGMSKKPPNVEVVMQVDQDKMMKMLEKMLI